MLQEASSLARVGRALAAVTGCRLGAVEVEVELLAVLGAVGADATVLSTIPSTELPAVTVYAAATADGPCTPMRVVSLVLRTAATAFRVRMSSTKVGLGQPLQRRHKCVVYEMRGDRRRVLK